MNKDDDPQRLLEPLRGEPYGLPAYDVDRAMADGRRRRRLRRWSVTAAVSAVTLVTAGGGTAVATALRDDDRGPEPLPSVVAPVPATQPSRELSCTMSKLPTGRVKKALVTSGDPTGRYLAGRVYPPGEEVRTVVWRDGKLLSTEAMPGSDATIEDLNTSGVGVGTSYVGEDRTGAFVLRDGKFTALDGENPAASSINNAGVIVGSGGGELERYPLRWAAPGAAPEKLPLPRGMTEGRAMLVDEDGMVVGTVAEPSDRGEGSGHLWLPDGTGRTLPLPEVNGKKAILFSPESIGAGTVAGVAVFDDGETRTFATLTYDIATNRYERLDAGQGSSILLSADGAVLSVNGRSPSIRSGKVTTDLPIDAGREYQVRAFSRDGRSAAGYSVYSVANKVGNEPVRWRCR
ncbi:hypothetical protein [Jidongwangia harbinensis]|uniref:hypothetical protein n=1 Tax=Jidongwangia harbinensis TaxID=2878561 RepID=UPI001CD9950A|nr:hypothetical protein [Jidongwangia harbinensis]MCA2211432.1 hypothetical protein [Jidongwangia harbinensis]